MVTRRYLPVPTFSSADSPRRRSAFGRVLPLGAVSARRSLAVALFVASLVALVVVTSWSPQYAFADRLASASGWHLLASAVPALAGVALLAGDATGRGRRWRGRVG